MLKIPSASDVDPAAPETAIVDSIDVDYPSVNEWIKSDHPGTLRGMWEHGYSVSSAYWDHSGRRIVSTSYDDKLRGEHFLTIRMSYVDPVVGSLGRTTKVSSVR